MSIDRTPSRRHVLSLALALAGTAGLGVGSAQAYQEICANPGADARRKKSLHYSEPSPDPKRQCDGCLWFEPRDDCGNCRILSTKVGPDATCDSWSKKAKAG